MRVRYISYPHFRSISPGRLLRAAWLMMVHIQYNLNTTISLFSSRHRAAAALVYGVCSACDLIKFGEIPWFFASPRPGQGRHVRAAQHRRAGDTACGAACRVSAACVRVAERGVNTHTARMRGTGGRAFVSVECLPAAGTACARLHSPRSTGQWEHPPVRLRQSRPSHPFLGQ